MKFPLTIIVLFLFLLTHCRPLPRKLSQASLKLLKYEVKNDSLTIGFNNPLHCPMRISANTSDSPLQAQLSRNFPLTLGANRDTMLRYWTNKPKEELSINFSGTMGNPDATIHKKEIHLPFTKGSKYRIVQAYNGKYSHTSTYSKCAIDFNLLEGDTICAAADGFVVGVIEGYTSGGRSKRWGDYANYITIFHPQMNVYTQYVHLMHQGSLVEVGDYVTAEQAIGLSGKTGQTDMEHLHFNVLKPNEEGMESTPIDFVEGYKGAELTKGDWVEK